MNSKTSYKRRNVIFLIPTLTAGGAERVLITLLKHLDREKFCLKLVFVDNRGSVLLKQIPNDIEVIDLNCTRVRYAIPKIIYILWRHKPDVVFSTLAHLNLALAILRFMLPRKSKYIVRETSIPSYNLRNQKHFFLWAALYKIFYGNVDLLVCQSLGMKKDLQCNFNIPSHKIKIINNPVDVDLISKLSKSIINFKRPNKDNIYFVAAGRLSPEKGFGMLIEAFSLVNNNISLDIIGEGPLFNDLKQLVSNLRMENKIRLVGYQDNPYAWFANADAFILSSYYEGFPNVVLEALACGTPVISTPAPGGVREILEGLPECRISQNITAESLADTISKWIEGPQRRVSLNVLHRFSLPEILPKYEEILL